MQRKEQEVAITEAQPTQGSYERKATKSYGDHKYADRTGEDCMFYRVQQVLMGAESNAEF